MKKLYLSLIVFIMGTKLFSQELEIYSFGETAFYPMLENSITMEHQEELYFSTDIGIGVQFGAVYFEANQTVDMVKSRRWYFSPYKEKYYFTLGIDLGFIQLGYQHLCTHGIDDRLDSPDQYDKLYIRFNTKDLK